MELDRLLDAYAAGSGDTVGEKLIRALTTAPARGSLRVDGMRSRLAKFSPTIRKQAEKLCEQLDADSIKARASSGKVAGLSGPGRHTPGPGNLPQRQGRLLFLPCHRLSRRQDRPGPDARGQDPRRVATFWRRLSTPVPVLSAAMSRWLW